VGFLKFLKRDKSKEPELDLENLNNLDIPPAPPEAGKKDFGIVEEELPELPEFPEMPEAEEPFSKAEEKLIREDVPSEKPSPELKSPPMPEFPKLEEAVEPKFPQPRKPLFGVQKPEPIFESEKPEPRVSIGKPDIEKPEVEVPKPRQPEIKPYERLERAAVKEERAVLKHKEAKEPIFVRVDRFRDILTGTGTIKNNLKTASQSIVKLNGICADRDKVLEKWSNVMMDLQKKLIFIDKTLFKK